MNYQFFIKGVVLKKLCTNPLNIRKASLQCVF